MHFNQCGNWAVFQIQPASSQISMKAPVLLKKAKLLFIADIVNVCLDLK